MTRVFETLGLGGGQRRRLRLLLAGGGLGLLLILLANALSPPASPPDLPPAAGGDRPVTAEGAAPGQTLAAYEAMLSARVAEVLRHVEGAGRVTVLVRLAAGEEAVYLQDEDQTVRQTTERDTQGGVRSIEERTEQVRTVVSDGPRGGSTPVVRTVHGVRVEGVVVVAEGAADPAVRWRLLRAVRALFPDLPLYRVEILEGR